MDFPPKVMADSAGYPIIVPEDSCQPSGRSAGSLIVEEVSGFDRFWPNRSSRVLTSRNPACALTVGGLIAGSIRTAGPQEAAPWDWIADSFMSGGVLTKPDFRVTAGARGESEANIA
jgi:hypothetical protein